MAEQTVIRDDIIAFGLSANLSEQMIALNFVDDSGAKLEIRLHGYAIFDIQNQIEEFLSANPEAQDWRKPQPSRQ